MAAVRLLSPREAALARPSECVPLDRMERALLAAWRRVAADAVPSATPFLHPAYATGVAEVRSGVEVVVLRSEAGEAVGFVPYRRCRLDIGGPVASRLCDFSGALVRPGFEWDPMHVVRAAGLSALRLSNVPAEGKPFRPFLGARVPAPYVDLSAGFDRYREASLDSGSSLMADLARKARRLERAHGPMRLEWQATDPAVLDTVLAWKAEQRKATRSPNVLELPWATALVDRLRHRREGGFAGVLSALYAGDTLCAVHFGLRTEKVLHYWIPAYDGRLGRDSPGLLCLRELVREAAARGIERVDLGPGRERYKRRAASGEHHVASATVAAHPAAKAWFRTIDAMREWSRDSDIGNRLRAVRRVATRAGYVLRSTVPGMKLSSGGH